MMPHEIVDLKNAIADCKAEIKSLKKNGKRDAARIRLLEKHVDTTSSPEWKRWIWWLEGFYFRKVGRWYLPEWTPKWPKGEGE